MAKKAPTTHQFVDIEKIEGGVVTLKNKNLRAILIVSSVNFDLKSSDEKQGLILRFQQFLNALDFSIEMIVQSRPLDLSEYFTYLRGEQEKQENELLRIQAAEYVDFVEELVDLANIMSKFFYIVVPYDVAVVEKGGFLSKLLTKKKEGEEKRKKALHQTKNELLIRVNQVHSMLSQMSIRALMLSDQEIVELFYGLYNPGVALKQKNLESLLQGEKDVEVKE